jgi:hypothetical protein
MSDDIDNNNPHNNAHHEEIEQALRRATLRGVRPELRPRVLAAVASQLQTEPASPWLRRSALAVAASLLLAVAMNIWASRAADRRLAQLFGPPPVSKRAMELAKAVESITDAQTAQWAYQRLAAPRPSGEGLAAYAAYSGTLRRLLDRSFVDSKGPTDETPQKDPQMDRNRPGRAGGGTTDCQRHPRLDHRDTA